MISYFDKNSLKILTIFSTVPGTSLLRKKLKEFSNMSNLVLDKTLSRLINAKILKRNKRFYLLNFENNSLNLVLPVVSENYHRFKNLPLNIYSIVVDIYYELIQIKYIGDVYLFGSYAKLIYNDSSDIDLAVVSDSPDRKKITFVIKKIKKMYKKEIEVHFFDRSFYSNKSDPLVKEILKDGVKLI